MASVGVGACMFALSRGVSIEALLEATGLSADTLLSPGAWVSQAVLPRVWELLATALPGRLASLEMADVGSSMMLGDLGKAVQFAPDLGSTMRLISRNAALLGDGIRVDVVEGPLETEFRLHHPSDELDRGYGAELGLGVASRVSVGLFGRNLIRRVEFRHRPLAALSVYTDFFGTHVRFEQPHNAAVIATVDLTAPNAAAEPSLGVFASRWLDRQCEEQGLGHGSEAAHQIRRAMLANAKRGDYTTLGLARTLGMSLRSLRRRLHAEGLEAQSVLEGIRRTYAMELLKDASLSIELVAERLGYADERSFRRAFARWTGMSPAQARRSG